jgi:competence protein ComEC
MLAVLLTRQTTLVYFAGSGSARAGDVGASVLLPYLRAQGRRRVDLLFISRADSTHAAGVDALFREMPVLQVLAGADPDAPCAAGQAFDRDDVAIRVLGPASGAAPGRNASCVLRIAGAGASVLIAGEIDAQGERELLERGTPGAVTLLVVPARGSHLASSPAFVAALRPRWAVIDAAHLNRFGYPRPEVIDRWRSAGAAVRQVSQEGAITLEAPARGPARLPPGERLARPRYWTTK